MWNEIDLKIDIKLQQCTGTRIRIVYILNSYTKLGNKLGSTSTRV